MVEPRSEPMPWPGYEPGVPGARLLSWSWAEERLRRSRRYWLATTQPGAPHLTALWGVWLEGALAISTGALTRKARNLVAEPRCSVSTGSAQEGIMFQGGAGVVGDRGRLADLDAAYVAKYGSTMLVGDSPVFLIRPLSAWAVVDGDPAALPTLWRFS